MNFVMTLNISSIIRIVLCVRAIVMHRTSV